MTHTLKETDPCITLNEGDSVQSTPLVSCCLLVTRTESGCFYAQHVGGTDWNNLSSNLFPPFDEVTHILMVTAQKSNFQVSQAHALQLLHRGARMEYYEWIANNNAPIPKVQIQQGHFELVGADTLYRPVAF